MEQVQTEEKEWSWRDFSMTLTLVFSLFTVALIIKLIFT